MESPTSSKEKRRFTLPPRSSDRRAGSMPPSMSALTANSRPLKPGIPDAPPPVGEVWGYGRSRSINAAMSVAARRRLSASLRSGGSSSPETCSLASSSLRRWCGVTTADALPRFAPSTASSAPMVERWQMPTKSLLWKSGFGHNRGDLRLGGRPAVGGEV